LSNATAAILAGSTVPVHAAGAAAKDIQSKLASGLPLSMTSFAIWRPERSVTVFEIVCHACHEPVFGTRSGPVTSTPSTSR
jgi:hypothetical protein